MFPTPSPYPRDGKSLFSDRMAEDTRITPGAVTGFCSSEQAEVYEVLESGTPDYKQRRVAMKLGMRAALANIIMCSLPQMMPGGEEALKKALSPYGDVVGELVRERRFATHAFLTGRCCFLMRLKEENKLPPRRLTVVYSDHEEEMTLTINPLPGTKQCHFCHTLGHARAECPVAPICNICKASTAHPPIKCPIINPKKQERWPGASHHFVPTEVDEIPETEGYKKACASMLKHQEASSGQTILCKIPDFADEGIPELKAAFSQYGLIPVYYRECVEGTKKPSGRFCFLLRLKDVFKQPPRQVVVKRDGGNFLETIELITGAEAEN
ncbi:hypothetical protein BCR37DRAFT_53678 [Protomyces lactucae-debilis]|uniref:Uncharacterized protein n=1 Tax=Protomyces lactucae-debilis TaxID=2754530 RepID=A0A1Y2FAA5_PROLT|nr:uncharacterized protein BCR37DRAFT_53678 [Protomyces lactucae-debilis]ORY80803.1 hypothetical protein BCR37DRAFT_53678 [Protomyces lactucae-debilis]